MGVQPTLPPGVHKLKPIKSLLKALQSLSLFASPVFPLKELILATLVSWPVALLKLLIFELFISLLNSLLITWLFDIVSELRVGICIYIIYSLFVIILLVILLLYIGIWSINSKIHSKITENNDAKIVDFSEDRGHFTGNFTGQITSNIEITLKINSKIKENGNENNRDFNKETNEILSKIKNEENKDSKIIEFNIRFNNEIKSILSNFIDNDISLFINNKNKDKFFKDFNDNLKDKKRDFNDNFNNITVSLFTGIENNISICYKFQNDFNDYFQDKNNKNINDYKSIYTNNDDKDKYFIYFSNFIMIDKGNFIDNFNDECVSFIMGIENNISIYIEEVPNETAPSIQGFAKPPAWDCRKEKNKRFLNSLTKYYSTMAKQIKEATETIVKVVRISGKTKPLAINGKENTDNVVFLRAFDAESGAKLDTPLSITESRAKMFGFSCLCISEETAERDNAGNMVEELNTLANPPKYYEMTLRVIPKGEPGEWGYKTKKAVTVDGKEYKAGELVPYRTTGTMIVEAIGKEYKDTDFKSAAINRINGAANAAGDMAYRVETFRLMFGRVPNMANEEDRNTLLSLPVTH